MQFNIGDVVTLKSGSPKMTIYEIEGTYVSCVWFVNEQPTTGNFVAATITR